MAGTHLPRGGTLSMQIQPKRRSLRKGTHSCWECKRRKMKCVIEVDSHDSICRSCRHRGSACVSQEVPEEIAFPVSNARQAKNGVLTPASAASRLSQEPSTVSTLLEHDVSLISTSEESLKMLSRHLIAALPSPEDTKRIHNARVIPDVSATALMTMPYTTLFRHDLETVPSLADSVDPQLHPILIARYMLTLALSLQHIHPDVHPAIKELSETPLTISERLVRVVNHYVTSRDQILGSIEALECITIESVYQANLGNLRRSWILARRALSTAQLMGLDRPNFRAQYQILDTGRPHDSRTIWRRIVFLDRFLCIMLGLPAACPDSSWSSDTVLSLNISKGERLEQIHCMIASRILESSRADFTTIDRRAIQELDSELQKAARALPTRWWLIPHLDASQTDPQTIFWNTGRMFAQVLHYNLVYRLHLPFMFRSMQADRTYEYSQITCISACREILSRFLALRAFNGIASSCRITDFIALMAALTLLLSHLQASLSESFLAHQYHTDRAMIEEVQETMEGVDQLKSDPMSAQSADLLRRLMAINPDEGDGSLQLANSISVQIPYYGIVKIGRDSRSNLSFQHSEIYQPSPTEAATPEAVSSMDIETAALPTFQLPSQNQAEFAIQHDNYPGLTADMNNWAFQGVDLAFFETILQSTGGNMDNPEGEGNIS